MVEVTDRALIGVSWWVSGWSTSVEAAWATPGELETRDHVLADDTQVQLSSVNVS